MKPFEVLFHQRATRMLALSRLGQIALAGLEHASKHPSDSPFREHFQFMATQLSAHHQNNKKIDIPEYRVVAFIDGLTLIATVSEIESYFQDLVAAVLAKHPRKLGKSTLDMNTLTDCATIPDLIQRLANRFASEMLFKKPNDYKKDLLAILSVDESVFTENWPVFVEAKARRDLGVHNDWIVNDIYRQKVREVGLTPSTDAALSVDFAYLQNVRKSCLELMQRLHVHCDTEFI